MQCRHCGKPGHTPGIVLDRVNEKGVPGIWECSPSCNVTHISNEVALDHALGKTIDDMHAPVPNTNRAIHHVFIEANQPKPEITFTSKLLYRAAKSEYSCDVKCLEDIVHSLRVFVAEDLSLAEHFRNKLKAALAEKPVELEVHFLIKGNPELALYVGGNRVGTIIPI